MFLKTVDRPYNAKFRLCSLFIVSFYLASCGGEEGGGLEFNDPCVSPDPFPSSERVVLSGAVSFDSVPHNSSLGLDYGNVSQKPARGVEVELLDECGVAFDKSITDASGGYTFSVSPDFDIAVRVNARLVSTAASSWDFRVTDNTNGNAQYVLQGATINSGTTDSVRELNAALGWGGQSYTGTRAAAPFAILDTVYEAIQFVRLVDSDIVFPPAELRWSISNSTAEGALSEGDLGGSFFLSSEGNIYLLGQEDDDTEEFDGHVIAHEFWHYFESSFSRVDSIGGGHREGDLLDFRLAFSEGFGNAFSGMSLDDPIYIDSMGTRQSVGFEFDLEENVQLATGWFSESSVQSILYDLYDSDSGGDGVDATEDVFGEMYAVLTSSAFNDSSAMVGIHLFLSELKDQFPGLAAQVDALANQQNFTVNDGFATGELNSGGSMLVLPLYKSVSIGGPSVEVCSIVDFGTINKLGVRSFVTLNVSVAGDYAISINRNSGKARSEPGALIWSQGELIDFVGNAVDNSSMAVVALVPGEYVLEVFDIENVFSDDAPPAENVCFAVAVN